MRGLVRNDCDFPHYLRFKEDKYLQIHVSTHLRQKKKKCEDGKKRKEEEQAKQIARSQCLRKRRMVSSCPVIRQNFINSE